MPVNVKYVKSFFDTVLVKDTKSGIVLADVALLFDELAKRKQLRDRALPVNFYPLLEIWCLTIDPTSSITLGTGNVRKIRGFGYKTAQIRELITIFVDGEGAVPENQEAINTLFEPLMSIGTPSL